MNVCMQGHSTLRLQNQKGTYPLCITILTAGRRLRTRDTLKSIMLYLHLVTSSSTSKKLFLLTKYIEIELKMNSNSKNI